MGQRNKSADLRNKSADLTERVEARVAEAALALDRRSSATRPKSYRRRSSDTPASAANAGSKENILAEQSLRRVFQDLGVSYRRFRKHTGAPLTPGLRDAAYAFRGEPSLTSLVAVAAFLDELDLLT
jgi:hypothetical protein